MNQQQKPPVERPTHLRLVGPYEGHPYPTAPKKWWEKLLRDNAIIVTLFIFVVIILAALAILYFLINPSKYGLVIVASIATLVVAVGIATVAAVNTKDNS